MGRGEKRDRITKAVNVPNLTSTDDENIDNRFACFVCVGVNYRHIVAQYLAQL